MNDQSVLVELDQIRDNPYQQRQAEDTDAIHEIAVSIFRNGLLQIPSARRANGHYELVFGHTRKAAYRLLATKGIPDAEIQPDVKFNFMPLNVQDFNDRQMFELATVENIKRRDLKLTEKARSIQRYMEEFKASSKEAGELFGMNDATVRGLVRLLDLPADVLEMMDDGTLSQGNARRLLVIQRIARKEVKAVANVISKSDPSDVDNIIATFMKNTGNSVEMWPSWRREGEPMAGAYLWSLRLPADKFPQKHLPALTVSQAVKFLQMTIDTAQDKVVVENWIKHLAAGGTAEEFPAELARPSIERLAQLINPPACTACPFYAKIDGAHWCTMKECHTRKVKAWDADQLEKALKKFNMTAYDHKVDGEFVQLHNYEEKHKKLVEGGCADLRLKKGHNHNNFGGVPEGFSLVVVGGTAKKLKAAEKRNENGYDREGYMKEQMRLRAIRDANRAAMNDFLWDVATPAFQSLLSNVSNLMLLEALCERFVNGIPAEDVGKKDTKAVKAEFYRRSILFQLLDDMLDANNDMWRISEMKKPVVAMAKKLQGLATTWGVKLPKNFQELAVEVDKGIVVAVETEKA